MILDTLVQAAQSRVATDKITMPDQAMAQMALDTPIREGFLFEQALGAPGMSFIAEVKKASPSKGMISFDYPYLDIAQDYQLAGAAAISVLTEPTQFLGSDTHLRDIAAHVALPILRKDFTIDAYQIYQARVLGASAVLLICSILGDAQLKEYLRLADSLGLSCLVETHSAQEVERAVEAGARVIGVNNRDLSSFAVDTSLSAGLRSLVPEDVLFVWESGVTSPTQAAEAVRARADVVLVGEYLMRAQDRRAALRELRSAALDEMATPMGQQSLCPAVKICGISRGEDLPVLNSCLPEYVGFVFAPHSRRHVELSTAAHLRCGLDPRILTVGVFVDAPVSQIVAAVQSDAISIVQLHGQESESYVAGLREVLPGVPVINAHPIVDGDSFAEALSVNGDYLLFDGPEPGSGQAMDWSLLDDIRHYPDLPGFFLAGGLNVDNLSSAMNLGVYCVDVSSGVETGGVKDPAKVQQFISAVRAVHHPRRPS